MQPLLLFSSPGAGALGLENATPSCCFKGPGLEKATPPAVFQPLGLENATPPTVFKPWDWKMQPLPLF